jgi:hypothetical protein
MDIWTPRLQISSNTGARRRSKKGETMKYLKILGLAAVAAMALMAFGAGTASATKLCTDSACTTVYGAKTEIKSELVSGTSARLTSGGSTIATCTGSTVSGKTSNESATWIEGEVASASLTWSGCSQTTHTTAGGTLDIMYTSGTSGEVVGTGFGVTVEIFSVSCTYSAGEGTKLGTITGGASPILKIETTVKKSAGSFLCPSTAGWDAEYVVTSPHALYVGA